MSHYYKYKFISPEPLYATVKEELRSYFDTGVIDDLMFPLWTRDCLDKMGRGSYKITETYLEVDGFQQKLPSDFIAVREAWMCMPVYKQYPIPGAYYRQTTMRITPDGDLCPHEKPCDKCGPCEPDVMHITYKTTNEVIISFKVQYLLKPGNISNLQNCNLACGNFGSNSVDSFDVVGDKFVTNFQSGSVYLSYYALETDDKGYQLIPDNHAIKEYIKAYLKYKLFEQLYNSVTDETFNQVERKYMVYTQLKDEAWTIADIETKKETIHDKIRKIRSSRNRFKDYNID
jgi:hypothetical protein